MLTNTTLEEMMSEDRIQETHLKLISPFLTDLDPFAERFIRIHGIMTSIKAYLHTCYDRDIPLVQEIHSLRVNEDENINIREESVIDFEEEAITLYAGRTTKTLAIADGEFLVGKFNIIEGRSTLTEVGYSIDQVMKTPTIEELKKEIESKQIEIKPETIEAIIEEGSEFQTEVKLKNIKLDPKFLTKLKNSREEIEYAVSDYLIECYNLSERIEINKYNTLGEEVNGYRIKRKWKRSIPLNQFLIENINSETILEVIDEKFTFKKPDGTDYEVKGVATDYIAEAFDETHNRRIGIVFYTEIVNPFGQIENDISNWLFDPSTAANNLQEKLIELRTVQEVQPTKQVYIWQVKIDEPYLNKIK